MHIEVDPGAVVGGPRAVQVENLALVPALVVLLHRGEVERRQPQGRVRVHPGGPALVGLLHVGVVPVVPNVDGDFDMLE